MVLGKMPAGKMPPENCSLENCSLEDCPQEKFPSENSSPPPLGKLPTPRKIAPMKLFCGFLLSLVSIFMIIFVRKKNLFYSISFFIIFYIFALLFPKRIFFIFRHGI